MKNKSALTLALIAALAAPLVAQADTILYGSARVSVDYNDDDNLNNRFNLINRFEEGAAWDVANNFSRLGMRGEEDLGGGLSAVYQYEFSVDVTEGGNFQGRPRPKFVGLKGGFGQLTVGTQTTPYYEVVGVSDVFNSGMTFGPSVWLGGSGNGLFNIYCSSASSADLVVCLPETRSGSSATLERLPSSVYYSTPDFGGFSASAMLVMASSLTDDDVGTFSTNEANKWSDGIDEWAVALKYTRGPFFIGATYIALNGNKLFGPGNIPAVDLDRDQWGIGLSYEIGAFSVGLTYEQGTLNQWGIYQPYFEFNLGKTTDTPWSAYLTGAYTFGNNVISAAYGQLDTGIPGADPIQNYVLGYQYNLSKRTRLWIEYVGRDAQQPTLNAKGQIIPTDPGTIFYGDQNAVSIGTRVDF